MITKENAVEIAKEYLTKEGVSEYEMVEIKDKTYKWRVEVKSNNKQFIVEVAKSGGNVLKYEIN